MSVVISLMLVPALQTAWGQSAPSDAGAHQSESTRQMADRLDEIWKKLGNRVIGTGLADPFLSRYFYQLKTPPDLRTQITLETKRAYQLLLDGKSQEAATQFQHVKDRLAENGNLFDRSFVTTVRELLAICYLRAGEQENCRNRHDGQSCILPIRGSGIHVVKEWSRAATREYQDILETSPDDLTSRWLLNVAYMTLGEYPEGVPKRWLIPADVFKSDYDIKRFPDVAPQLGLDILGRAGGCALEDFDGDGYLDLMASSYGLDREMDQLRYFHNNADGTFTERTKEAGLLGITGGLYLCQADYNNDGYPDVVIPRGAWLGSAGHHPLSLLRNNGDGTFSEVSQEAGLISDLPSQVVAWVDYDNDGWLDLFKGNESPPVFTDFVKYTRLKAGMADAPGKVASYISAYQERNACQLFHNNGDGTFTDVAASVGLAAVGWVKGAAWGDFNNDGWPDLYISRLLEPNLLFENRGRDASGRCRFEDVTQRAGVAEPLESFPTWFFDYDNDGWLDLFVSGYTLGDSVHWCNDIVADYLGLPFKAETPRLYRNNRDGTFTDVSRQVNLNHVLCTMGSNYGDLDNDGYLDLFLGTGAPDYRALMPNRVFRNAAGKRFQDVTTSGGFGHLQKGHAVSFGDVDNDGDQDVYEVIGGVFAGDTYQNAFFLNPGHGNHFIALRLEGVRSNRSAIGARLKVVVDTTAGSRSIYSTVNTGGSFGANCLQREIGLGQAKAIRAIEITWPATGRTQVLKNVKMDQFMKVREGESAGVTIHLKKLDLLAGGASSQHTHPASHDSHH